MVHAGRQCEGFGDIAQKDGFLAGAFDQVDRGVGPIRERACEHKTGETGTGAEIEPDFGIGREIEQLQRVRDMAGPQMGNRARPDQIGVGLCLQQQIDEAIEPAECFT